LPLLSFDIEKEDHILQCRTEKRQALRNEWLNQLLQYLSEPHTLRGVMYSLYHQVKVWLEPGHSKSYKPLDSTLIQANEQQGAIGWRHFLKGRLTITWGEIINNHIAANEIPSSSAEQLGIKLIQLNWKHILQLWYTRNE
jgi:hypothetical protein